MDVYQPGLDNDEICLGNKSRLDHIIFSIRIHHVEPFLCVTSKNFSTDRLHSDEKVDYFSVSDENIFR